MDIVNPIEKFVGLFFFGKFEIKGLMSYLIELLFIMPMGKLGIKCYANKSYV